MMPFATNFLVRIPSLSPLETKVSGAPYYIVHTTKGLETFVEPTRTQRINREDSVVLVLRYSGCLFLTILDSTHMSPEITPLGTSTRDQYGRKQEYLGPRIQVFLERRWGSLQLGKVSN
jgi:hypothetical protein